MMTLCMLLCFTFSYSSLSAQTINHDYGKVIKVTKKEFVAKVADIDNMKDWKYLGDKPAIIDFYASWCAPCRQISPILDALAKEYKDDIYIYKIDTDKEKELAKAFGITALPTLLFVPLEGQPIMTKGAMQKPEFERAIKEYILKTNDK